MNSVFSLLPSRLDAGALKDYPPFKPFITRRHTVTSVEQLCSLPDNAMEIVVEPSTCNEENAGVVDLSRFHSLKSFRVGDCSLYHATTMLVRGLGSLQFVDLGMNCMKGNEKDSCLSVTDCSSLLSLNIGACSFCDYVKCDLRSVDRSCG